MRRIMINVPREIRREARIKLYKQLRGISAPCSEPSIDCTPRDRQQSKFNQIILSVLLFWTILSSFFQVIGAVIFSIKYGFPYLPHFMIVINGLVFFVLFMMIGGRK